MMEKKFKLLPPMMPNFISIERPARPRQEGFEAAGFKIAVGELTEDEAKEYGNLMRDTFIEHWRKRRSVKLEIDRSDK